MMTLVPMTGKSSRRIYFIIDLMNYCIEIFVRLRQFLFRKIIFGDTYVLYMVYGNRKNTRFGTSEFLCVRIGTYPALCVH